jgi:hypothetical protein
VASAVTSAPAPPSLSLVSELASNPWVNPSSLSGLLSPGSMPGVAGQMASATHLNAPGVNIPATPVLDVAGQPPQTSPGSAPANPPGGLPASTNPFDTEGTD